MGKDAAMLWNKENIKRRSVLAEQKVWTEASYPTVLTYRKGNPEIWKNNLQKKAVNTVQEFSHQARINKDGRVITKDIKNWEMEPPCPVPPQSAASNVQKPMKNVSQN